MNKLMIEKGQYNCSYPGRALIIFLTLVVAALQMSHAGTSAADLSENREWAAFAGLPGGGRYSALDQINTANVKKLTVAWTYHTGDLWDYAPGRKATSYEVTPILNNGMLYLCTPLNRVIALNPVTGNEIWTFDPHSSLINEPRLSNECRGVAYWESSSQQEGAVCQKRVFKGDHDGRIYAVDADTGKACPDFGHGGYVSYADYDDRGEGHLPNLKSPPVVLGDLVLATGGVSSNERADASDGVLRAFDVRTGEQRWVFFTIPEAMSANVGAADVWAPFSVDVERNWVFLATGSPSPDPYGVKRLAPIPYANAVIALDAATGQVVWSRQLVHHDIFDYDLPEQPALIKIHRGEELIDAVAQVTKMGTVFVLRRDNGEPLFPIEERPVPASDIPGEQASPTQPYPVSPAPFARQRITEDDVWGLTPWDRGKCLDSFYGLRYEGPFTPPSEKGSLLIPANLGGGNWGGAAYDPARNLLVVKSNNMATAIRLMPITSDEAKGRPDKSDTSRAMAGTPYRIESQRWLSPLGIPCVSPPWGEITAINLATGDIAWRRPLGQISFGPFNLFKTPAAWGSPSIGGPIITAGGLVFIAATMDSAFRAYDIESGLELWRAQLPVPGMAVPMTYAAGPDQRQFVVIAAGGNTIAASQLDDAIIAYALPSK